MRNAVEFREAALTVIRAHFSEIGDDEITERESREGTYLSLSVTVHAETREQIDAFYRELSSHDSIMMAL